MWVIKSAQGFRFAAPTWECYDPEWIQQLKEKYGTFEPKTEDQIVVYENGELGEYYDLLSEDEFIFWETTFGALKAIKDFDAKVEKYKETFSGDPRFEELLDTYTQMDDNSLDEIPAEFYHKRRWLQCIAELCESSQGDA